MVMSRKLLKIQITEVEHRNKSSNSRNRKRGINERRKRGRNSKIELNRKGKEYKASNNRR